MLEFTGAPLTVPYTCNNEDLQWAGLACTEGECPIYVELSHAAGQASTILMAGDFHASAATMDSLLLRSTDGGHTWREPVDRIRGAELGAIQIYDVQTAWVSGEIMQPLAMDPFFPDHRRRQDLAATPITRGGFTGRHCAVCL